MLDEDGHYVYAVYGVMDVEFDDVKDAANLAKHGVSLALGAVVLANPIGEVVDDRRRIISVRRASRQEQRIWLS
jgi:uncharacterized DUF497 family protein